MFERSLFKWIQYRVEVAENDKHFSLTHHGRYPHSVACHGALILKEPSFLLDIMLGRMLGPVTSTIAYYTRQVALKSRAVYSALI